ncbi:KRAB-A domain-containing protein 2-like [Leptopilina heterotoma]|uniref:KRAB-A domain-containing protein 2-like n=1 Tax=Leptopilina heterotoma TaxID=63436 RepID=UPI001CA8E60D|nr:KRAB-A domain-containing protein 2-like [Leptopilina heterotoma]
MGPLTPSSRGNVYILVIQDLYTKWIEIQPLRKATGLTISAALQDLVINRWGSPKVLLTDNGTEFVNNNMKALATKIGFRHMTTPPYRPQADPVERVNRVVRTMIIAFIERSHREWDLHLPEFRFAHNTAYHSSIQSTPAFLNFGREPSAAISLRRELEREMDIVHQPPLTWSKRMQQLNELRSSIVHALDSAFQKQSLYYNRKRRDQRYEVGDLVWKKQRVLSSADRHFMAKLADAFHGPFIVTKRISNVVYVLEDLQGQSMGKFSVQDLKPYHAPLQDNPD